MKIERRAFLRAAALGFGALVVGSTGGYGTIKLVDQAQSRWRIAQAKALITSNLFDQTANEPKFRAIALQMLDRPVDPTLLAETIEQIGNLKEEPDKKYVRLMIAIVLLKLSANNGFGRVTAEMSASLLGKFTNSRPIPIVLSSPEEASAAVVSAKIFGQEILMRFMFNLNQLDRERYDLEELLFHELTHIFDGTPDEISAWSAAAAYAFNIMGENTADYLPHRNYDLSFGNLFFDQLLEYNRVPSGQKKITLSRLFKASRIVMPADEHNLSGCGSSPLKDIILNPKLNSAMGEEKLLETIKELVRGREPSFSEILLAKHNFNSLGLTFKNRPPELFHLRKYLTLTHLPVFRV